MGLDGPGRTGPRAEPPRRGDRQRPLLADELVFRGGTCLHKLHLPQPLRYSEDLDLDYVRTGPIGLFVTPRQTRTTMAYLQTAPALPMATKLRALYQRRKGRDLFDLWHALTTMKLHPEVILACLPSYRPDGYTSKTAISNLRSHLADKLFRNDLRDLVVDVSGYDIDAAGELIIDRLLAHVA